MSKVTSEEYPTYSEKQGKNTLGEIIEFLTEMSSQDNRGTAFPYYYVIRDAEYIPTSEDYSYNRVSYYDPLNCVHILEDEYNQLPQTDEEESCKDDFNEVYEVKKWAEKGMFLTEKDAQEHLERNHYHYSDEAHTYVKCAWRAPHLEKFFTNLFEFFGVKIPPDLYYENKDKEAECKKNS